MSNGLDEIIKEQIKTDEGFKTFVAQKLIEGEKWMKDKETDCTDHKSRTERVEKWAWKTTVIGSFIGCIIGYVIAEWKKL